MITVDINGDIGNHRQESESETYRKEDGACHPG